jgi:probable F420-dependent oxidoreductase
MSGRLGIWFAPEGLTAAASLAMAQKVEALGYESLWIGETFGRDPFAHLAWLGSGTTKLVLATGIANIYNRHPGVMKQAANTLAEQMGGRFVLGLGVSSPVIVQKIRGLDYTRPFRFLGEFLEKMEKSRYFSIPPAEPVPVILGVLGPKAIALSAEKADGAHTYNVTPAHTARAREILGPDKQLIVEQKVLLQEDPAKARKLAKSALSFYARAPGYRNAWKTMGFSEEQIDAGDHAWLDAIVAWGDAAKIRTRIDEHFAAGASQVLLHPLHPELGMGLLDENTLEVFAPCSSR